MVISLAGMTLYVAVNPGSRSGVEGGELVLRVVDEPSTFGRRDAPGREDLTAEGRRLIYNPKYELTAIDA